MWRASSRLVGHICTAQRRAAVNSSLVPLVQISKADASAGQLRWRLLGALAVGGIAAELVWSSTYCEPESRASAGQTKRPSTSTVTYTKEEVAKHDRPETGIWVTHGDGVYDITEFVEGHPGGKARIMLAAGGSVDPFWAMYRQHQTGEVQKLLEGYRIGNLEGGADTSQQVEDPYANEPERHRALIVRTEQPFNAETPPELLTDTPTTPNDFFYVRNHLPVPHVDPAHYSLRIEGEGLRTVELSLRDLQTKFRKHSVPVTLQCSGNRRNELAEVKPIKGLGWDAGAIGTAMFSGPLLRDVLRYAGFDGEGVEDVRHIQFEGLDSDVSGVCYGASIPMRKAVDPYGDVIVAYEMNGRALPLDHGFPVRVVVPGVTGARSVKWLSRIIASRDESGSHWQQADYKSFSPSVDWDNVDWKTAPAIQETNVQSAICSPKPGSVLEGPLDTVTVSGYAFSGGGKPIIRVDVSPDAGASWTTAALRPISHHSENDRPCSGLLEISLFAA